MTDEFDVKEENNQDQNLDSGEKIKKQETGEEITQQDSGEEKEEQDTGEELSQQDSGEEKAAQDTGEEITQQDSGEGKAKLDKDDIAEELLASLDEIIGESENKADDEPDSGITAEPESESEPESELKSGDDIEDLDDLDLSGNELDDQDEIQKADLDKDGMPDEIFTDDKAILDKDGMSEVSLTPDKASLDTEVLPKPEKKKEKTKKSQEDFKQVESDESIQTFYQKIIARIKQFSLVKVLIAALSVMSVLLICMGTMFFILFSGSDQKKTEDIFADNATVSQINLEENASLTETYEMKTFVIPMNDSERGRVFFKVDFILTVNKVDLIQLNNNSLKIREAVYNQFYNMNSEIVLKKLKKSEQLYKLKNVLNLIFIEDTIKNIEMVNYKFF